MAASRDVRAQLALDVYALRLRQEIAAAAVYLPRLDAVIFTGEIGVDQPEIREAACAGLAVLSLAGGLDPAQDHDGIISTPGAAVPVLLVHPHEERQIAIDVRSVLRKSPVTK